MVKSGVDATADDFVEFHGAGTQATGRYRCAECGYGITIVHGELPTCPMCAGASWEVSAWTPFSTAREFGLRGASL